MTTADAMPASWDRERWNEVDAQRVGAGRTVPRDLEVRAAVGAAVHRGVGPVQPDGRAERLGERLLGGEPRCERVERQVALAGR